MACFLNKAGRFTLINLILSSSLIFYISIYEFLKHVGNKLCSTDTDTRHENSKRKGDTDTTGDTPRGCVYIYIYLFFPSLNCKI